MPLSLSHWVVLQIDQATCENQTLLRDERKRGDFQLYLKNHNAELCNEKYTMLQRDMEPLRAFDAINLLSIIP